MKQNKQGNFLYKQESYTIRGGAFEIYKQFRNKHKENIYQQALVQIIRRVYDTAREI